jgi:hypothetical protein
VRTTKAPALIDDEMLTTKELAKIRRKSESALRRERMLGEGPPFIQDGGRTLYPKRTTDEWMAARLVTPGA